MAILKTSQLRTNEPVSYCSSTVTTNVLLYMEITTKNKATFSFKKYILS